MTIVHLNGQHQRRQNSRKRALLGRQLAIAAFLLVNGLLVYFQFAWLLGGDDGVDVVAGTTALTSTAGGLPPCPPIDLEALQKGLVCIDRCAPSADNTLLGLGLDPNDRVNISMNPDLAKVPPIEYGKYRIHFPEENVHVNITGRLATEMKHAVETARENGEASIMDHNHLHPRSIMERLLRRIVAQLLRAGVLDPSKSIVNTGSWIGDNAVPWALLMQNLRPDNPGNVVAVDPSPNFVQDMVDLANVNGIGNLCAHVGVLSSGTGRVAYIGSSAEHVAVQTEENINQGSQMKRQRFAARATFINSTTVDALNLESVSLLHLDVEGHEGELLEGARKTIEAHRPIIITEGFYYWPEPRDKNDQHVLSVLTELGYTLASEIREYCGIKPNARNRIWWPDEKTRDAAMAVVGTELRPERKVVPWIAQSKDLD